MDDLPDQSSIDQIPIEADQSHRWAWLDALEGVWSHSVFQWSVWGICVIAEIWWWFRTPSPGKAGIFLAVAAAIMSALGENLKGLAKFCWVLMLFAFLMVEYRAINQDRANSQKQFTEAFGNLSQQADNNFKETLRQSNENLKQIIQDEHTNFGNVLVSQQKGFLSTLDHIVKNDQRENERFSGVLAEQQKLFQQETNVDAYLRGRLIPANDLTPGNACSRWGGNPGNGAIVAIAGENAAIVKNFPYTALKVKNSEVGVDKSPSGGVSLRVDMRDANGDIIIKLDENGVRGDGSLVPLRPDRSTVLLEDRKGHEVFRARYLNENAFEFSGHIIADGGLYDVTNPSGRGHIRGLCGVGVSLIHLE